MHISEGVLPGWMLISGYITTGIGTFIGLKKLNDKKIVITALLSAAFFVASLIHVPIGPSSVHLILNGLAGLLLGWIVFPAFLIGLFLQAILFQFGGIIVLGVNTFNVSFPALISFYLCKPLLKKGSQLSLIISGILASFISILGAGILVALELVFTNQAFIESAKLVILVHIPVAIIESIITSFVLVYVNKVSPEILEVEK